MQQCEYFLIRYVPNLLRGEYVNFGIVLLDAAQKDFAEVRWAKDLSRVRCLDADADLEYLTALEQDLKQKLSSAADRAAMLQIIEDSFSNAVQVSPTRALVTDAPNVAIERLAKEFLEPSSPLRREEEARGRAFIRRGMQDAFDHAGVLPLMMRNISVAPYTHAGDPLKLDFGYRPNGTLKFFHAVSLAGEITAVKPLCYTFAALSEGVARKQKAETQLTAVVEDNLDRKSESVGFALYSFDQARIQVAALAEMPRIAEAARKELRA